MALFFCQIYIFYFHVTPSCAIMVTEGMVDYREIRMDENKIFCFLLCTENHIRGRKKQIPCRQTPWFRKIYP